MRSTRPPCMVRTIREASYEPKRPDRALEPAASEVLARVVADVRKGAKLLPHLRARVFYRHAPCVGGKRSINPSRSVSGLMHHAGEVGGDGKDAPARLAIPAHGGSSSALCSKRHGKGAKLLSPATPRPARCHPTRRVFANPLGLLSRSLRDIHTTLVKRRKEKRGDVTPAYGALTCARPAT